MRELGGFRSDRVLAMWLRVPQTTLSGWRRGGSIPMGLCVDFAETFAVDLNWLLTGKGDPEEPAQLDVEDAWDLDHEILGIVVEQSWAWFTILQPTKPGQGRVVVQWMQEAYFNAFQRYQRYVEAGISRDDALKALRDKKAADIWGG